MPQLVWTATPDGTIDFFNRRWLEYTGVSVETLQTPGDNGVVHPDDLEETVARWGQALRDREPYQMEYRLQATDGTYRWFLSRAVPEFDERGDLRGWIGTATDIDEQRRARADLEFVVEAGNLLSASLDVSTACEQLAELAVKGFADWCFVTLLEDDGTLSTVAIAHRDPARVRYVEQFRDRYPPERSGALGAVIDDDAPLLVERILPEQLRASARTSEHLRLLQELQMHSVMIVPLSTPEGGRFGCISLISAESGRIFTQADLAVAQTVAVRAASVIGHARLFDREKRTSQRLRFTSKASQLFLQSPDVRTTLTDIADIIVSEMADLCFVALIEGEGLRIEALSYRDPRLQEVSRRLRGTRPLHPDAERRTIARLRTNEPYLRAQLDVGALAMDAWPYLSEDIRATQLSSALTVPLRTRGATYGGIFAYYTRSSRTYSEDDLPVFVEVAQRASLAIDNANALERERRIATTLQRASLPALIPKPAGLTFDTVYAAAGDEGEVGGDWYDALELDDGSVVVSVGDVTGHGLEAAVIMSKVRHVMVAVPLHERDPARILDAADWVLRKRFPDAIVTAFSGIISPDRRTIRFASAGHPAPYLRRSGELFTLQAPGLPLGLRKLREPQTSEIAEIGEGDVLLLYTDGLTEWNRKLIENERRLRDVMRSEAIRHTEKPASLVQAACMGSSLGDDVAILSVAVDVPGRWSIQAEDARAAEHARGALMEHLSKYHCDASLLVAAELVFGELIGNAVRHAPGPLEVQVDWTNRGPVINVIDRGPPFQPTWQLPHDSFSESGRGLYMIGQVSEDVLVERVPGYGNYVRVALSLRTSASHERSPSGAPDGD